MRVYTIGFTRKSAESFFDLLRMSGAKRVVDIRLNNSSQLAGFAKRDDLAYFLQRICGMGYEHLAELAPTQELLDAYRGKRMSWEDYETEFLALMSARHIERMPIKRRIANACLLCSEESPDRCHRRLVAEYLLDHWGDVDIVHLT